MQRIDVSVKKDIEVPSVHIINNLFNLFHHLLARQADQNGLVKVGIGFPEYDLESNTLGRTISLYGNQESLAKLQISESIPDIDDFAVISDPRKATSSGKYFAFKRVRFKDTPKNKIKRAMKRHGYSKDEAKRLYANYYAKDRYARTKGLPFTRFVSSSTGQAFSFCIKREECSTQASKFSTFGLQVSKDQAVKFGLNPDEFSGGVPI